MDGLEECLRISGQLVSLLHSVSGSGKALAEPYNYFSGSGIPSVKEGGASSGLLPQSLLGVAPSLN
jgi:hypothetical protein